MISLGGDSNTVDCVVCFSRLVDTYSLDTRFFSRGYVQTLGRDREYSFSCALQGFLGLPSLLVYHCMPETLILRNLLFNGSVVGIEELFFLKKSLISADNR